MHCYYCITSTRQMPVADVCVLEASTDADAMTQARGAVAKSAPVDLLKVYHGERLVAALHLAPQSPGRLYEDGH
jgi:hypothetical protein